MNNKDLSFSTKARTLKKLQGVLKNARIAPMLIITVESWRNDKVSCLENLSSNLGPGPWIVRSSCYNEDTVETANAGAFLTLLNVEHDHLDSSIEQVISSYGNALDKDEVLIQPMLSNVVRSGVAFSHDPNTCSPYQIINWLEGSDTSAVTGGLGGNLWQKAAKKNTKIPKIFKPILTLLEELLYLFKGVPIDCEFAITSENNNNKQILWLLQARPLILNDITESENEQFKRLDIIKKKITSGMLPNPFLVGKRTVYGVMPDWNPAEIIGIKPKPMALSLYRELITDSIWAYQRHNYGYRNLRSFPLMPHFEGLPYIDVRVSFNSFIPADLNEKLANKLVDHYINRLLNEPNLHDKVEFEIVLSCYTFDLSKRLNDLKNFGFTDKDCNEIKVSLRKLTKRITHHEHGLWRTDKTKLQTLIERRERLQLSSLNHIDNIYWLLEDAKRYGTLPFAGLARAGFIAVQMLKSMVSVGVLSKTDEQAFLADINTVTSEMSFDRAELNKKDFLSKYGHLRPGTYDVLSPRYDEQPDLYFDWSQPAKKPKSPKPFSLKLNQMREISKLLDSHGLDPDPVRLFDFIKAGIELRELSKFYFSRNLSDIISLMIKIVSKYGYSREDLAFSNIEVFKELHVGSFNPKDLISLSIEQGKVRYKKTLKTCLPPIISSPDDVLAFYLPESLPNFITLKNITAPVIIINDKVELSDKIVCIENADPGFDWIFSHNIAGLITAWGGANSHMAIRAGEMGLPAVIGAGEMLYQRWSSAKMLNIDCSGNRVEIIS